MKTEAPQQKLISDPKKRANLAKLRDFLLDNHEKIMKANAFKMFTYVSGNDCMHVKPNIGCQHISNNADKILSGQDCGTSACAMGWASYLFPEHAQDIRIEWMVLADALFVGMSDEHDPYGETRDTLWQYLFDRSWSGICDTPAHTAYRINVVLSADSAPESDNGFSSRQLEEFAEVVDSPHDGEEYINYIRGDESPQWNAFAKEHGIAL